MIKAVSILTRKTDMSHAEFAEVWLREHAPLVRSVPEVRKYVLSFTIDYKDDALGSREPGIDGIAELWYTDRDEMERAAARPEMHAVLENGALYLSAATTILTEEVDII